MESLGHVRFYPANGVWGSRKARGDASPCAGAAQDPPSWIIVPNKSSLSLSLSGCSDAGSQNNIKKWTVLLKRSIGMDVLTRGARLRDERA
jgi:hypothetical protein